MNSILNDVLKSDPQAPVDVWRHFEKFCQHPRPSKHEEKIKNYIKSVANQNNLKYQEDEVGNIIIYVPATKGFENCEPILIQNHVDMVTDALPEKKIDFFNDPIIPWVDGEWVKAQGTTLGADNGIGAAISLALIDNREKIKHPPLELLFTIDEETGLTGALELDANLIKSQKMLNIDTEEWGSIYIGCAGGLEIKYQSEFEMLKFNGEVYNIKISGLVGGHSGIDIHRQRGNALVMIFDLLQQVDDNIHLISFSGGKAHNIIPRNATLDFAVENKSVAEITKIFESWKNYWNKILPQEDQEHVQFHFEHEPRSYNALNPNIWHNSLKYFLTQFPHGAHQFVIQPQSHEAQEPLVRLSNNLAKATFSAGKFSLLTSIRFFEKEEGERLKQKCLQLGFTAQIDSQVKNGYPSWAPNFNSKLLSSVSKVFEKNFNNKPTVKAIHAGLECGIITDKKPGMEAVSFGPLIIGAHSPDEKVLIADVTKTWKFLCFVLADFVG